uniref:DUF4276 family protein n=1 Tax=Candidatus Kentrum sp. LFY TaxID=2126342 RepID=A0A450W7B9_9GAMM|nr:MAG: protein of unknown function (DUF4276) [Candidatus Kentron sp. LFY]
MIVFLVEEESMCVALRELLPKIFPDWKEKEDWRCIPHEGKADLENSVPRKLRGWRTPGDRFVILRDQDESDCLDVKRHLVNLCKEADRPDILIRIPCRELEAWFLGDLPAIARAYDAPSIIRKGGKKRFRDTDAVSRPSDVLYEWTGVRKKIDRARRISTQMDVDKNLSPSFNVFVSGLRAYVSG